MPKFYIRQISFLESYSLALECEHVVTSKKIRATEAEHPPYHQM